VAARASVAQAAGGDAMPLKALLFDVDGTLVDTEELHRQAFNRAFQACGLNWTWDRDLYAALLVVSGGAERISTFIDGLDVSAAEKTLARRLIPAIHREKTRLYGELSGSGAVHLRPGIRRLIDEALHVGLQIGLASTSALTNVRPLLLAAFGPATAAKLQVVISANLVQRKKPAPDLYELLLNTLGLSARACVAFEDSANGLLSAKAAGYIRSLHRHNGRANRLSRGPTCCSRRSVIPKAGRAR